VNGYFVHFVIGIALAKHFRDIVAWLEPRLLTRVALALFGWFFASYNSLEWRIEPLQRLNVGLYLQALGAALLIAVASSSPGVRSWLSRGLIHRIGRISFSLYLIHMLILICLTPRVMSSMTGSPPALTWAVGLAFTVLVSLVLSEPLYRFVETPTMALGRSLSALTGSRRDDRAIGTAPTVAGARSQSGVGWHW
jgi:peptidoglycan/LPS O-acetylase OafA/YrhL